MKKSFLLLTLVLVMFAGTRLYAQETQDSYDSKSMMGLKVGLDTAGESNISNGLDVDRDVDAGVSLGWDYTYFYNNLGLGAGIIYQIPRELKDAQGKFYFVPLYALLRYDIPVNMVNLYGIGQIGYSYYQGDSSYKQGASLSGGLYWGAGAGATFMKRYQLEVLYSESRGTFETPGAGGGTYTPTTTTNPPDGFYYARSAAAPAYVLNTATDYDIMYRVVTISLGINFALPLNK